MTPLFDYKDNFLEYRDVNSILQYGDYSQCLSPLISVFIPVYNSPKYFKDAINSVIHQDCEFLYEIIVVDNTPYDGGKNDILLYIESLNLNNVFYYRNEKNIGMCGNWNRAIELCRADYISICHDDDMLMPSCLSTLWSVHDKYPNKVIFPAQIFIGEDIHYPARQVLSHNDIRGPKCFSYDKLEIFKENPSNGVGCLFNRSILIELGGYNNEYFPALDYALYIKYVFKYGGKFYREPLYYYRKSEGNTSYSVYEQYPSKMNFLWDCMIDDMKLPNFVSKRIKTALFKNFQNALDVVWGKRLPSLSLNRLDMTIFYLLQKRKQLKMFFGA